MFEKEIITINRLASQLEYDLRSNNEEADENKSPIFELIENIINLGLSLRASDIHIIPLNSALRLRYRIDGALFSPEVKISAKILARIISRIKVLARIKSTAVGEPVEGHIFHNYDKTGINIRVSIIPVKLGESVALRIMNDERHLKKINELSLESNFEDDLKKLIHKSNGMIIVSGPMNSGKTTSIYAMLQEINSPDINIMTIEDPVEGVIEGINQITVNNEANLSFAKGLRTILRMDANAIMVGEIRDEETAKIAVRAALTGHLIFSTLHANDSISAIFRLREMGVPNYLISATLSGIIAQRLVRKLCPYCKKKYLITDESPEYLMLKGQIFVGEIFYKGEGCDFCHNSGYYGRILIHELLRPNAEIRKEILKLEDIDRIRTIALKCGFKSMLKDAIDKARMGLTTLEEIGRTLYAE